MGPLTIAQVSADATLANSRAELLRIAGYEVQTFASFNELLQNSNARFDLLIIGHSLEYRSIGDVEQLFRSKNPHSPILQLVATDQKHTDADILFDVYKGPDKLLELVRQMVENRGFRRTGV